MNGRYDRLLPHVVNDSEQGEQDNGHRSNGHSPSQNNGKAKPIRLPDEWVPFPVDVLPHPLGGFVHAAAESLNVDESLIALPLLAGAASAIGSTRSARAKADWHVPPILWTVTVVDSGGGKSPAIRAALKPVYKRHQKQYEIQREQLNEYEVAKLHHRKSLARWNRDTKAMDDPPAEPERPAIDRSIVDDVTIHALVPILAESTRGTLVSTDEIAAWLESFGRFSGGRGSGDVNHWLSLHDGTPIILDRKTDRESLYVSNPSASITGGIQPGRLQQLLLGNHASDGLIPRILFAMPPRRKRGWSDAEISADAIDDLNDLFAGLYALEHASDNDGHSCPALVGLTPGARDRLIAFVNNNAEHTYRASGHLASVGSKIESTAIRLALVCHCVRSVMNDTTLQSPDLIDEADICCGVTLAEWFRREAGRVFAVMCETDGERDNRQLVEWIEQRGGAITVRDLMRGPRRFRDNYDEAEQALDGLLQAGLGKWHTVSTATNKRTEFRLSKGGDGDTFA